jgi:hypothetical protein
VPRPVSTSRRAAPLAATGASTGTSSRTSESIVGILRNIVEVDENKQQQNQQPSKEKANPIQAHHLCSSLLEDQWEGQEEK